MHDKVVTWEERGQKELGKAIGCSGVPLDAHESEVRQKESLIGNFMTDAIRAMHHTDAAIVPGGSIRGDKVFPKGKLTKTLGSKSPVGAFRRFFVYISCVLFDMSMSG